MEIEIWKDVIGYEGLYQISSLGNIKTYDKKVWNVSANKFSIFKSKVLKQKTTFSGYKRIGLVKNKKQKFYFIHRILAFAFIENTFNKPFINHIDGIKTNNTISNLEWCTQSENEKHAHKIGLKNHKGINHPSKRKKCF